MEELRLPSGQPQQLKRGKREKHEREYCLGIQLFGVNTGIGEELRLVQQIYVKAVDFSLQDRGSIGTPIQGDAYLSKRYSVEFSHLFGLLFYARPCRHQYPCIYALLPEGLWKGADNIPKTAFFSERRTLGSDVEHLQRKMLIGDHFLKSSENCSVSFLAIFPDYPVCVEIARVY